MLTGPQFPHVINGGRDGLPDSEALASQTHQDLICLSLG